MNLQEPLSLTSFISETKIIHTQLRGKSSKFQVSYTPRKPVIFTPAKGKKHTYQFWF